MRSRPPSSIAMCVAIAASAAIAGASPQARADHEPVIAIPGNPYVPVIINGVDASWAVVEGDWGLYRPKTTAPTVYGGTVPFYEAPPGGYYPKTGRRPRYGRLEVVPRQIRRAHPQSYHRSWSTDSGGGYPPYNPPPVIRGPYQ